jgi:hypothetical protein
MPGPDLLRDAAGALVSAAILAGAGWPSWLTARRVLPDARTSVRLAGTVIGCLWLLAALFWLTAPLGLFHLGVLLPLLALLALGAHRFLGGAEGVPALRADLAAVRERLGSLMRQPAGLLLAGTGGVALVRALRGTAGPPLGWDSLTYHLFKAGRWVQQHGLEPHAAPDAWGYYEYFPLVGDLYWAWAMLPFRGDLALAAAGAAMWAAVLLATYGCAVTLGAAPSRAALAAAAVGAMPSVLAYVESAYVDNTTLALFLLGVLFLARLVLERRPAEAPLAVAAFALMLGTKLTTAGLFALAAAAVVWLVLRAPAPWPVRRVVLLACLAVAAAGAPGYLRAWVEQGSPFFPFHIEIGGVVLSEGSEDTGRVAELFLGEERYHLRGAWKFWWYFLGRQPAGGSFVNPGPGILVFGLLALLAVPSYRPDRRRLVVALFLLAVALTMFAGFFTGNMEVFRKTIKVSTSGRYLTPAFAALAVVAARWDRRSGVFLWGAAVLVGLWLARPVSWAPPEVTAMGRVALALAGAGAVTALAALALRRGRLPGLAALAVAALALSLAAGAVGRARAAHRYEIWAAAADPQAPTFHMHALNTLYASAWPIWEALDDERGHRLAVTAGWDRVGHNWYRYPLLGSRLQNRVLYVPVTTDGGIADYREPEDVARRASFGAWLERLVEAEVDHVVSLAPRTTIEDFWMRRAPELFEPAAAGPQGYHLAYRFDREAAVAALATSRTRSTPPPEPTAPGSPGTGRR